MSFSHAIVTFCAGSAEEIRSVGMLMQPDEHQEVYWNAHLLNARGMSLEDDTRDNVQDVLFAWHLYLAMKPKV